VDLPELDSPVSQITLPPWPLRNSRWQDVTFLRLQ
jgi:hypothetical protein